MFSADTNDGDRIDAAESVTFADFESDLTAEDWMTKRRAGELGPGPIFWAPIEVLSPIKTVGKGRTNLTVIAPTILQTDATEPYAGFDLRESPNRNPVVAVHFNPGAYGATGLGTYVFTFAVEAYTRCGFTPSGYAGSGTVDAPGSIRFSGRRLITIILRNVQPGQDTWTSIEQTSGENWAWFSTRISHPPLVFDPI
ncbi:hypothetical protein [Agromyces sp. Marseille-P2726]|uniref:hypothetical protein n=1 Tax=Agromyces sp. Marseille-P2726 TaxID=2709132 RepID=UPI00156E2EA7|nr:hypothetical protein [Agromyces sp. Marseille-P2726]